MGGAVAAGNRHTADAGAWALSEGGRAVDAVVAAALTAFVAEGPLTGPAGGGFLLVSPPGGEPELVDCFFEVPSRPPAPMDAVVIDFGDASTQVFLVGEASVAVPGLLHGLALAHERHGALSWSTLATPALELARQGLVPTPEQRFLHEILVPILQREAGGRRVYGNPDRIETGDLVPALERIRDVGTAALMDLLPELSDDLSRYRPVLATPLECGTFGSARIVTTPSPSRGGAVIAAALAFLQREGIGGPPGTPEEAVQLVAALTDGYGALHGAKPTGTTHISVVTPAGEAAGLSSTLGSGSGVFRHGFQLNNMLGELDVIGPEPHGAGERLPSMMAPTLALERGVPRLVVGSAGSVRLAGAIVQVLAGVIAQRLSLEEAISRPRVHVEPGTAHLEGGWSEEAAERVAATGRDVVRWAGSNLYFGGVSAVELCRDGSMAAAGDPRRGGFGVVVS